MIALTLTDQAGKVLLPKDLTNAADLCEVADKARAMARECERLMHLATSKKAGASQGGVPYLT